MNSLNFTLDFAESVVTLILRSHVKLRCLFKLFKYVNYHYNRRGMSNGYRMDQTHSLIDNTSYDLHRAPFYLIQILTYQVSTDSAPESIVK